MSQDSFHIEYSPKFLSNNDFIVVSKEFGLPLIYNEGRTYVSILITSIIN